MNARATSGQITPAELPATLCHCFDKAGRHVAATAIYKAAVAREPNLLMRILTEPHWE